MNESNHEAWTDRAARLLDDSAEALDAATLSRLNRSRHAALASRRRASAWTWGGFAAVGASAIALVLAFGLHRSIEPAPIAPVASVSDDEFSSVDDIDLYADLEFYAWLETEPAAIDGSGDPQLRSQ